MPGSPQPKPPGDPKRQHFVPACYLKFFSLTPEKDREALIYQWDGLRCQEMTVESVCAGNWTYSREKPTEAELLIRVTMEDDYPHIARRVRVDRQLNSAQRNHLMEFIVHLHARNPRYKNESSSERIVLAQDLHGNILRNIFRHNFGRDGSMEENHGFFHNIYKLRVFKTRHVMLASDNPSICLSVGDVPGAAFICPIDSHHVAVLWHSRLVRVVGPPTEMDQSKIVSLVTGYRNRFLYCYADIPPALLGRPLATNGGSLARATDDKLFIEHHPVDNEFEFLKAK